MERYGREILWAGGTIAGLVSGMVAVLGNDAPQAFLSGMLCAACVCALAERIRDRTLRHITRSE